MAQTKVPQPAQEPQRETETPGILIITREQYDKLRDVVWSVEGFYQLLKENQNRDILPMAMASVLRPICSEMLDLYDGIKEDPAAVRRRLIDLGQSLGISIEFTKVRDMTRLRAIAADVSSLGGRLKEHPGVASLLSPIAEELADLIADLDERFKEGGAQ